MRLKSEWMARKITNVGVGLRGSIKAGVLPAVSFWITVKLNPNGLKDAANCKLSKSADRWKLSEENRQL